MIRALDDSKQLFNDLLTNFDTIKDESEKEWVFEMWIFTILLIDYITNWDYRICAWNLYYMSVPRPDFKQALESTIGGIQEKYFTKENFS